MPLKERELAAMRYKCPTCQAQTQFRCLKDGRYKKIRLSHPHPERVALVEENEGALTVLPEFEWFRNTEAGGEIRLVNMFLEGWRLAGRPDMRKYAMRWGTNQIHCDVLTAVKPDADSGNRYLQKLAESFASIGLDHEWSMYMLSSNAPGSQFLIWLHHRLDPDLDWQRPGQECLMCWQACVGSVSSLRLYPAMEKGQVNYGSPSRPFTPEHREDENHIDAGDQLSLDFGPEVR